MIINIWKICNIQVWEQQKLQIFGKKILPLNML